MPGVFVGVDVAKATLDVALLPTGESWSVPNDDGAIEGLSRTCGVVRGHG